MLDWILNHINVPIAAGSLAVVALLTFKLWLPIYMALPSWVKQALLAFGAIAAAYLAGRKRGAETAVEHEIRRSQDAANDKVERLNRVRRDTANRVHDEGADPYNRD